MNLMKFYNKDGAMLVIHIAQSSQELRSGQQKSYTEIQARNMAASKGYYSPRYVKEAKAFKRLYMANKNDKPLQKIQSLEELVK